jgi:hypothetical protein
MALCVSFREVEKTVTITKITYHIWFMGSFLAGMFS